MGEIAVTGTPGDELVVRGLGSCIALALVDRVAGVAGAAHIVLPESQDKDGASAKFANLAVPELIALMCRSGATQRRLEAVLVGGARMFDLGGDLDIGARNDSAVRTELAKAGITIRAAATGGNRGRTLRVTVTDCTITVKEAGGEPVILLGDWSADGSRPAPARPAQPGLEGAWQ